MTAQSTDSAVNTRGAWIALVTLPVIVACAVMVVGAWLAIVRGLKDAALTEAMEQVAPIPTAIGFALGILWIRRLARRDGYSMADLGWARPSPADVGIGLGAAGVLWALNAYVLYPIVIAAQPSFDPQLHKLSLLVVAPMLLVAIAAEDTLYRGYAFKVLQSRLGTTAAVAITTAFYAFFALGQGLPVAIWAVYFGCVLCGIRLWRGSLWPVAIAHALVSLGPKLLADLGG